MANKSDDEEDVDMRKIRHVAGINKKTTKSDKEMKAAAAKVKRKEKKKNNPGVLNFRAMHMIKDPQGFAEKIFGQHIKQ